VTRPAPPPERPGEGPPEPELPDPRPFRRIQAVTAALLALGLIVTLTSDRRPAEVRWGTLIGVALLALGVFLVTRRRGGRLWRRKSR
jgi:LPXTG-motif cell wall-anchored protein